MNTTQLAERIVKQIRIEKDEAKGEGRLEKGKKRQYYKGYDAALKFAINIIQGIASELFAPEDIHAEDAYSWMTPQDGTWIRALGLAYQELTNESLEPVDLPISQPAYVYRKTLVKEVIKRAIQKATAANIQAQRRGWVEPEKPVSEPKTPPRPYILGTVDTEWQKAIKDVFIHITDREFQAPKIPLSNLQEDRFLWVFSLVTQVKAVESRERMASVNDTIANQDMLWWDALRAGFYRAFNKRFMLKKKTKIPSTAESRKGLIDRFIEEVVACVPHPTDERWRNTVNLVAKKLLNHAVVFNGREDEVLTGFSNEIMRAERANQQIHILECLARTARKYGVDDSPFSVKQGDDVIASNVERYVKLIVQKKTEIVLSQDPGTTLTGADRRWLGALCSEYERLTGKSDQFTLSTKQTTIHRDRIIMAIFVWFERNLPTYCPSCKNVFGKEPPSSTCPRCTVKVQPWIAHT